MKLWLVTCCVLATALCGCGSDSTQGEAKKSTESEESPTDGIVMVDTTLEDADGIPVDGQWAVRVFDSNDGSAVRKLTLPTEDIDEPDDDEGMVASLDDVKIKDLFSPDMRYAAIPHEDGIQILKVDADRRQYVPQTTITPSEGSYSGGEVEYANPQFSPDGDRLWFEAEPSQGATKLMSVDYRDPGKPTEETELRSSKHLSPTTWRTLPDGNVMQRVETGEGEFKLYGPDGPAQRATAKGAALSYVVDGKKVMGGELVVDGPNYPTPYLQTGTIDDNTMVMRAAPNPQSGSAEPDDDRYGPLISVEVDPRTQDLTITPIGKDGADPLTATAVNPERDTVLLVTNGGWFLQDLDNDAAPTPLRKPVGDSGHDAYAWTK